MRGRGLGKGEEPPFFPLRSRRVRSRGSKAGEGGASRNLDPERDLELNGGGEDSGGVLEALRQDGAALRHAVSLLTAHRFPLPRVSDPHTFHADPDPGF